MKRHINTMIRRHDYLKERMINPRPFHTDEINALAWAIHTLEKRLGLPLTPLEQFRDARPKGDGEVVRRSSDNDVGHEGRSNPDAKLLETERSGTSSTER